MTADAPKKPNVKARLPRGLGDRGPADLAAERKMMEKVREVYERYGFEAVETPFIEYTEALGKFLPDTDRPNEGVFSFQDDDEQWMSLRYDLTAPLARYVAENFDALPKPYRSYRAGWVFRNEKPGPGRFRQFMQFDADTVGASSPAADAEICMMAADTLEALGLRGKYVIKVNNRKLLDGVMDSVRIPIEKRLAVLRAIDKLDRLGIAEVTLLLGLLGRTDGSGDHTKGAGLDENQIEAILSLVTSAPLMVGRDSEFLTKAEFKSWMLSLPESERGQFQFHEPTGWAGLISNHKTLLNLEKRFAAEALCSEGIRELREISLLTYAAGYRANNIRIDPSVVRGLEYYTGPVFEAELFVADEAGKSISFGSVGGGGRYDGLVGRFRGEPVPATGFSIGVSRLFAALKAVKSNTVTGAAKPGPVVVLVLDKDRLGDYQKLVTTLRHAGIRAEMYLGSAGMNAQLKYADKRGSLCAVIQGSNEREKGEVMIRDLVLGAQLAGGAKERADYLELRQKAQFPVAVDGLVVAVKEVLARHS